MNIKALEFYRRNSNFTENSIKAGTQQLLYFDTQSIPGGRNRFVDSIRANDGLKFYGTPGEYSANYKASKYISALTPPNRGKVMFSNYEKSNTLTKKSVFPGIQENDNGRTNGSPFHMVMLYFPGKSSLILDTNPNSNNYKNWI